MYTKKVMTLCLLIEHCFSTKKCHYTNERKNCFTHTLSNLKGLLTKRFH